jgi:hypothetical protein
VRGALLIAALVAGGWLAVAGRPVCAADGTPVASRPRPAARSGAAWRIIDPGHGPVTLPKGDTGARELGGITWASGTRYYAVSDKLGTVFPLSITIDPRSGAITHAVIEPGTKLPGSTDLEGIAYDGARRSVLVSDEVGPAIREYRIADGQLVRSIALPAVYRSARRNLSLESLSRAPDDHALWTANEETLSSDGALSSFATGSVVRLQRFDAEGRPSGQWAYQVDALAGDLLRQGRDIESSGVSDLVALPGGALLVLERAYGAHGLRIRIYEVDFAGATDIAAVPSLVDATVTPVRKTRLWQQVFPNVNYEGAALGPALAGGGHSLLLLSDDGHQQRQTLYALTLRRAD